MELRSVIIKNNILKSISTGEKWFGRSAVTGAPPKQPGVVRLLDSKRNFRALAFVSPDSKYLIRIITTQDIEPDYAYWAGVIKRGFERRRPLFAVTDAFRVIHAEADGIPSVIIDKYNDVWAIQINSSGAETIREMIVAIIKDEFAPASIIVKNKTDGKILYGKKSVTTVKEFDLKFALDVLEGQKTGAYLDYRGFRKKLGELARGDVLDLCCYQGWAACHMSAGAKRVVAVDSSRKALNCAEENAKLNKCRNIGFVESDMFDYLDECTDTFDLIHIDPPSMAKEGAGMKAAAAGYSKLLKKALPLLNKDGILFISSCSNAVSQNLLENIVSGAVKKAGRSSEIIYRGIQDNDHPLLKGFAKSLYLKAIACRVAL